MEIRAAAKRNAEIQEALHIKKYGHPLEEEIKEAMASAYIDGARYMLRHVESVALYSSRGTLDRLRELRDNIEQET